MVGEHAGCRVTGTLDVRGAIAAPQSGDWNGGITATAAVTSADETVLVVELALYRKVIYRCYLDTAGERSGSVAPVVVR